MLKSPLTSALNEFFNEILAILRSDKTRKKYCFHRKSELYFYFFQISGESDLGPVSYLNHDWNKPHEECKTISQPFKRLGDNCPHWFVLSMNLNDSYDSDCESWVKLRQ